MRAESIISRFLFNSLKMGLNFLGCLEGVGGKEFSSGAFGNVKSKECNQF